MKQYILSAIFMVISILTASAQKNLDKLFADAEKDNTIKVIYSEQRNPATGNVSFSKVISCGAKSSLAARAKAAMESDRPRSTSYSHVGNRITSATFDVDGKTYVYTIINSENGNVLLTLSSGE